MYKVIELATGMIQSYDDYVEAITFISNNVGFILQF